MKDFEVIIKNMQYVHRIFVKADEWTVDADTATLVFRIDDKIVAAFAHGFWVYVILASD